MTQGRHRVSSGCAGRLSNQEHKQASGPVSAAGPLRVRGHVHLARAALGRGRSQGAAGLRGTVARGAIRAGRARPTLATAPQPVLSGTESRKGPCPSVASASLGFHAAAAG